MATSDRRCQSQYWWRAVAKRGSMRSVAPALGLRTIAGGLWWCTSDGMCGSARVIAPGSRTGNSGGAASVPQVGEGLLDHRPHKDGRGGLRSPGPLLVRQLCINQVGAVNFRCGSRADVRDPRSTDSSMTHTGSSRPDDRNVLFSGRPHRCGGRCWSAMTRRSRATGMEHPIRAEGRATAQNG